MESTETSASGESQNRFINYIGPNNEPLHEPIKTADDAKRILRTVIQNEEKQLPGTSYKIRDTIFRNSQGTIDSI